MFLAVAGRASADLCLQEAAAAKGGGANCSTSDTSLLSVSVTSVLEGCGGGPGDTFTFDGTLHFQNQSGSPRKDLGIYIGSDPFFGATCFVGIIPPLSPNNLDDDSCGDLTSSALQDVPVTNFIAPCADSDGDGFFDFSSCLAWGDDSSGCDGPADAVPATSSKCGCATVPTNLHVPAPTTSSSTTTTTMVVPVSVCGDGRLDGDEQCEDGNTASGDGCDATCQRELCNGDGCTMFATSTRYRGSMGGFSGADAKCNLRAREAGLPGHFRAWLGSADAGGFSAVSRLDPASGPFVRTCGGGIIATDLADLLDSTLSLPVGCDEFGTALACTGTWTGSYQDGTSHSNGNPGQGCANWSDSSATGITGDECATGYDWTALTSRSCSEERRIYCIEQDHPPVCGNHVLELGEDCDDGNTVDGDACPGFCIRHRCEFVVELEDAFPEKSILQFDVDYHDGQGFVPGDGSVAQCTWLSNEPAAFSNDRSAGVLRALAASCSPAAGPGDIFRCVYQLPATGGATKGLQVTVTEALDRNRTALLNRPNARIRVEGCGEICGDGAIAAAEECDDANSEDGDGCTRDCLLAPSSCGDGILQDGEECDEGSGNGGPAHHCRSNCRFYGCGDGITDVPSEGCDDGNVTDGDGCSSACLVEYCGDGVLNNNGETCEDGNSVAADGCGPNCHLEPCRGGPCTIFVTSTFLPAQFGGLAGGDTVCNSLAAAAELPGGFKAWLSIESGSIPARSRLDTASGPFLLTCAGEQVAPTVGELTDGNIEHPIRCDEFGAVVEQGRGVWTGTNASGSLMRQATCNDWDATDAMIAAGLKGVAGDEFASTGGWSIVATSQSCGDSKRLYCVEQYAPPECGNSILEEGEGCDDGNIADGDGCEGSCSPSRVHCGDANADEDEECDEGFDAIVPNHCRPDCQLPRCGDGTFDSAFEDCDDGNLTPGDGCSAECTIDTSLSDPPFCGDSRTQTDRGEECDFGPCGADCCTPDCHQRNGGCGASTSPDNAGTQLCGNHLPNPGEECDEGQENSSVAPNRCRLNCMDPSCGDNVADWARGEQCDGGALCTPGCLRATAATCGDNIKAATEQCDDGNRLNSDCCSSVCTHEPLNVSCVRASSQCITNVCNGAGACGVPLTGTGCDDGNPCTENDKCNAGVCTGTTKDCSLTADSCNTATCNAVTGDCQKAPRTNGTPCNDGLFCNGTDTCSAGACSTHVGTPCPGPDGDSNCAESCNEAADNCTTADPNGSACNDGLFCNGADTCSTGTCSAHAGTPCPNPGGDGSCGTSCDETTDNCTTADSAKAVCAVCGDGVISASEQCDDGDTQFVHGQLCADDCTRVPCGRPTNSKGVNPSASDALFALKTAVDQKTCAVHVCDVNGNFKVGADDALRILKASVGHVVVLTCPLL